MHVVSMLESKRQEARVRDKALSGDFVFISDFVKIIVIYNVFIIWKF